MNKKFDKNQLAVAVGAAFLTSLGSVGIANAESNPFEVAELQSGYIQLAEADGEGKCGEGKCGGEKSDGEGKCGEGKCGTEKTDGEGKCGEGKCGGDKE